MTKPAQMQKAVSSWKKSGDTVALVPTMGALHAGHVALIRHAAKLADRVVVSVYVNPTQFNSRSDFLAYPKRLRDDRRASAQSGVDVLFRPQTLYAKDASTWVEEQEVSKGRCGARRPGHFRGVATVVVKLLSIVQPDWMVLGEKDGQQCAVLERVVRDLFYPVRIVRHPTVREKDGLPLSSRNHRLNSAERVAAGRLARAVQIAAGKGARGAVPHLHQLLRGIKGVRLEYAEIVDGVFWVAAWVGKVRLIDHRRCRGR